MTRYGFIREHACPKGAASMLRDADVTNTNALKRQRGCDLGKRKAQSANRRQED
jgi:hypothetical protein